MFSTGAIGRIPVTLNCSLVQLWMTNRRIFPIGCMLGGSLPMQRITKKTEKARNQTIENMAMLFRTVHILCR